GIDLGTPLGGGVGPVDVQVAPMPERSGAVLVFLTTRAMAVNIDRQLSHRDATRSIVGLASILGHEIKNPLSGIRGAAQLLGASVAATDQDLPKLIIDEVDRICRLIDRMEVFTDDRPLSRQPVNIHQVFDRVHQLARTGFASGIRFVEDYDPSLPLVLGNQDQLIQVFLNLVKNAAEAITSKDANLGSEGVISLHTAFRPGVRLSVPGTHDRVNLPLEFIVADNGPGVADDILPNLFDPFVTTKTSGSGLGLSLVAKIVGDHGGVIDCTSDQNGTRFRVLMPMHENTADQNQSDETDQTMETPQ
ncbi:MAG: two-component system sensor histidine kinase NtrB, partial [Alphaproteobacteria bacterium]